MTAAAIVNRSWLQRASGRRSSRSHQAGNVCAARGFASSPIRSRSSTWIWIGTPGGPSGSRVDGPDFPYFARWVVVDRFIRRRLLLGKGCLLATAAFICRHRTARPAPWFCFTGWREYHDHPSPNVPWASIRREPRYLRPTTDASAPARAGTRLVNTGMKIKQWKIKRDVLIKPRAACARANTRFLRSGQPTSKLTSSKSWSQNSCIVPAQTPGVTAEGVCGALEGCELQRIQLDNFRTGRRNCINALPPSADVRMSNLDRAWRLSVVGP